jgi:hypothetical protein
VAPRLALAATLAALLLSVAAVLLPRTARWSGVLWLEEDGPIELQLRANGRASAALDGRPALAREAEGPRRVVSGPIELTAGPHRVRVECAVPRGRPFVRLHWSRTGESPREVEGLALEAARLWPRVLAAAWVLSALLWVRAARLDPGGPAARVGATLSRWAPIAVLVLAGLLRFEAVVERYWLEAPPWARTLSGLASQLRPEAFAWEPKPGGYGGDPHEYLGHARRPRGLFEAHHREPLFILATKAMLALTGGADVAISLASALFSTLLVAATYHLGQRAFGRWVGILAAALLAVERDVVALAADGWRDDAFAFFFVASCLALLRLAEAPSPRNGLLAGALSGLAGLTRVTALSFVVPGFLWAAWPLRRSLREHGPALLAALLAFSALLGPYLASCWLRYGDPLFPISVHTAFYRDRAGQPSEGRQGVFAYLAASRPEVALLDTVVTGMTRQPFAGKWGGFEPWDQDLGRGLAGAALLGLAAFATLPRGRFLLLMLAAVLVPYAATWDLWGEWRFTLPAYPLYLLAAAFAIWALATGLARPALLRRPDVRRRLAASIAIAVAGVLAGAVLPPALHAARAREALAAGAAVRLEAGDRDRLVFSGAWQAPRRLGRPVVRFSRGTAAQLDLPLAAGRSYAVTLRVDPFRFAGAPPQTLVVSLNGERLAEAPLAWDARRIGSVTLMLPARLVRPGRNRLELRAAWSRRAGEVGGGFALLPDDWETAFLVWYVRLEPLG